MFFDNVILKIIILNYHFDRYVGIAKIIYKLEIKILGLKINEDI